MVKIDKSTCIGCYACCQVCPGNLLHLDEKDGKAYIIEPDACWDCASCIKECPTGAIKLYLAPEAGGKGTTLSAEENRDEIVWQLEKKDKTIKKINVKKSKTFDM